MSCESSDVNAIPTPRCKPSYALEQDSSALSINKVDQSTGREVSMVDDDPRQHGWPVRLFGLMGGSVIAKTTQCFAHWLYGHLSLAPRSRTAG